MPSAFSTTARTGFSLAAAAVARSMASATSSAVAVTVGTKRTTTASTCASSRRSGSADAYVFAVAPPSMSTGFSTLASGDRSSESAERVSSARPGRFKPGRLAGVGAEDPETTCVGQDRDAAALELGLVREQRRDVDQLFERGGTDDARLVEEGVDGDLGAGQRCGVRARRALAARRRSALERQDRLGAGDTTREPAEPARIAERLDVHEDDLGRVVLLPPLQQVVGGDVRLVADRHERRQTEAA